MDGHEVSISNPSKILFPKAGVTKRDLVHYYLTVAEGALRGAGGRPNVLVRRPDGVEAEVFFQKRAPDVAAGLDRGGALKFPSGRTAEEVVPRDAAALAWMANLACMELHPHPVRADDLDHPDELRVDLDPVPGVPWPQVVEVARVVHADARRLWPDRLAQDVRLARHPRQRPHRATLGVHGSASRRGRAGARGRAARARSCHQQVVEGGTPRRVHRLQPEREGPDGRLRLFGSADAGRSRLGAADWEEIDAVRPGGLHVATMPARFKRDGRSARRHRHARGLARRAARTLRTAGERGPRRCALAAAVQEAARRAAARSAVASPASTIRARAEHLRELVRRSHFELVVAAVCRLLVGRHRRNVAA